MAKTGAERQAAYRKRHGSNGTEGKINQFVSVTAVTRLGELTRQQGMTKKAMLEKLILGANEQTTNTISCRTAHLDKLKRLADCYAVTLSEMLERLIDDSAVEKFEQIHEAHDKTTNPEMARFLYDLFEGDRLAAYQGYKKYLYYKNPGWVYVSTKKGIDALARRFDGVDKALWTCDRKAKKKASTPEEILAL